MVSQKKGQRILACLVAIATATMMARNPAVVRDRAAQLRRPGGRGPGGFR